MSTHNLKSKNNSYVLKLGIVLFVFCTFLNDLNAQHILAKFQSFDKTKSKSINLVLEDY